MVFYALLAVLDVGDEVLVPDPGFPIYPSVVRFAGAFPFAIRSTQRARWMLRGSLP